MVIRDLTLRSAVSFGSFHLIRLLYDEYMFYLVEHRVAHTTGETAIAVMSEFSSQRSGGRPSVAGKSKDMYFRVVKFISFAFLLCFVTCFSYLISFQLLQHLLRQTCHRIAVRRLSHQRSFQTQTIKQQNR